jgi:hypothetical protein
VKRPTAVKSMKFENAMKMKWKLWQKEKQRDFILYFVKCFIAFQLTIIHLSSCVYLYSGLKSKIKSWIFFPSSQHLCCLNIKHEQITISKYRANKLPFPFIFIVMMKIIMKKSHKISRLKKITGYEVCVS